MHVIPLYLSLALHSSVQMQLFAYLSLFSLWGLSGLVSNLVSPRDRNKLGAIWGILQHIWATQMSVLLFFHFTTSQTSEKLLLRLLWWPALSPSLSLSAVDRKCQHDLIVLTTQQTVCLVETLEPEACYCTPIASVTGMKVNSSSMWLSSLSV